MSKLENKIQNYLPIIGLEVHVELKTKSKMFCSCSARHFLVKPNTHTCPVCLGLPGALPVPNKKAIEWCIVLGLALDCKINKESKFDRKNYFYPDLPKGYQISQYDQPLARNGKLKLKIDPTYHSESRRKVGTKNLRRMSETRMRARSFATCPHCYAKRCRRDAQDDELDKTIRINRVHLEEDTAKLIHQIKTKNEKLKTKNNKFTLIDFNRSGVPLVEVVSEPDINSSDEVVLYLKKIQQIIRYLGISDADMEKGSMRCEANISLHKLKTQNSKLPTSPRLRGAGKTTIKNLKLPNYKVEVKNINSFRFVKKAIEYEIERQKKILESGEIPKQETRGYDENKGVTFSQRGKEEAHDYRYFPEPDIPPIRLDIKDIKDIKILRYSLPELPDQKINRFMKEYGLNEYVATILAQTRKRADYFEKAACETRKINKTDSRPRTDYVKFVRKIANVIVNKKVNIDKNTPAQLVKMVINKSQVQVGDEKEIEKVVRQVLKENSKAIADYKKGKTQVIGFLIGQVMRGTKGKANPAIIQEKIKLLITITNY